MSKDFCHLHVHSEYSVLDGINKIGKLTKHVKESGMSACALTDHGNLHGVVEFYKKSKDAGIKGLIGVEAYITENEDGLENPQKTKDNYHCIMIAMNETGLKNLFWLTNQANQHNFYYRPRIYIGNLEKYSEGILATSSCLGGVAAKRGTYTEDKRFTDPTCRVRNFLERFATIFNNRFYAEIQDNPEIWQQTTYNQWLINEAKVIGIPTVITADAHFLTAKDMETHKLIMAQNTGKTLKEYDSDEDGLKYTTGHRVRTPDEMLEAALRCGAEESFYNTIEVANKCDVNLTLGKYQTPLFDPSVEEDYPEFLKWKASARECL